MTRDDQFEKRLQRPPLREVPPAWREEILEAARGAASARHASRIAHHVPRWRELFWPCPQAWAALAAVWLVIFALNFAARDPSPAPHARQAALPSREMREMLKAQEQLFAELAGPFEKPLADRPRPAAPTPRSSRREEFLNA